LKLQSTIRVDSSCGFDMKAQLSPTPFMRRQAIAFLVAIVVIFLQRLCHEIVT
jgi:hypothetical protein